MSKKHTPRPPITEALDADPVSDLTAAEWMVSAARRDSSALSAATTGKLKVAVTPKYQLLAIFDDVCTHVMLDSMYLGFRTRKMTFEHPVQGAPFGILSRTIRESPNSLVVDREEIARIVRRAAAGTIGSYTAAHAIIVSIPWLRRWCESLLLIPESIQFLQHLRRYVEMYDRDAKFDIVRCGRFTPSGHGGSMPANGNSRADSRLGVSSTGGDMLPATSPDLPPPACDAMLVANRDLPAHSSLTLCTALLAPVTSEVSDAIDDTLTDFSMIHSKELGECLLAGPLRFANHDCKPNCRYSGGDRMHRTMSLVTLSAVAAGEPLVVDYSTNYFGPGNVDCLCASCEKAGTSGFGSQQVRDAQRAAAIPSDGQSRYVGTLDDGRTPSSDDTASDSGSSSRGARVNPPRQAAPRAVGSLSVIPMPSTSLSDKLTSSANRHLDRHGISREAAIALVDATDAAQMPRHGPLLPHAVPCSECKLKAYGFQVTAQGMVVCDKCLRHVLIYGAKWPETNTSHASNRHGRIAQAKRVIDLDYVRTCARKAASASTTTTGTPFLASASPVLRSSRDSSDDATFPLPETEVMFVPKVRFKDDAVPPAARPAPTVSLSTHPLTTKRSATAKIDRVQAAEIHEAETCLRRMRTVPNPYHKLVYQYDADPTRQFLVRNFNERALVLVAWETQYYAAVTVPISDWDQWPKGVMLGTRDVERIVPPNRIHNGIELPGPDQFLVQFVSHQSFDVVPRQEIELVSDITRGGRSLLTSVPHPDDDTVGEPMVLHSKSGLTLQLSKEDTQHLARVARSKLMSSKGWAKWRKECQELTKLARLPPQHKYRPVANLDLGALIMHPPFTDPRDILVPASSPATAIPVSMAHPSSRTAAEVVDLVSPASSAVSSPSSSPVPLPPRPPPMRPPVHAVVELYARPTAPPPPTAGMGRSRPTLQLPPAALPRQSPQHPQQHTTTPSYSPSPRTPRASPSFLDLWMSGGGPYPSAVAPAAAGGAGNVDPVRLSLGSRQHPVSRSSLGGAGGEDRPPVMFKRGRAEVDVESPELDRKRARRH